jgi:hypothetical protein
VELAAVEPVDDTGDQECRHSAEREQDQCRAPGVRDRIVDPVAIAIVVGRVGLLLGDDRLETRPAHDPHPGRRGEGRAWI